jgi:DedD protein
MGLFSFLNKNKQETAGEDSGYFSRDEDSAATRARSKRASSANEPAAARSKKPRAEDDPVLPEKKRARRRLVGAVALALAVAVGLPMLLDSEPKPLASDIAIQIPSRDKAAPLPVPAAPGAAVLAADSLDKREEIVEAPKADAADIKSVALNSRAAEPKPEPKAAVQKSEPKPEPKAAVQKSEPKPEPKAVVQKPEPKPEPKAEPKLVARAEPKPAEPKPVVKAPPKAEEKPAAKPAQPPQDAARALAILEGKAADKAAAADTAGQKFVVQVAALGSAEKVAELQEKLREAGISSVTHKVSTPSGERIQVRVGPFSHDDADKMRARVDRLGLPGSQIRPVGK